METERLVIDSIRKTDKRDYFDNISHDKKVLETFMCRYAESYEEYDFSSYVGRSDMYAIRLKNTQKLIGVILCFDEVFGKCEIGYGLGSSYWGCGYATEAVRRFIEFCFEEKGLNKVFASFFDGNEASKHVMEKCGMIYSHHVENEFVYLGKERSLTYFCIAKKDWNSSDNKKAF